MFKESIIYAYRLTSDSGSAPCIYDLNGNPTGLLTLACCKGGQIRHKDTKNEKEIKTGLRHTIGKKYKEAISTKQIDVFVMGIYKDKLLYFAKITDVLSMREYFAPTSPFKNRHDFIYEFSSGVYKRNDNNPYFHSKDEIEKHRHDRLGEYALISDCFAYFGKKCENFSKELIDILPKYQENKHYKGGFLYFELIWKEVSKFWDFKKNIQNEPHDYRQNKSCNG